MFQQNRSVYLQYFHLGDSAFRDKVRYYEEHPDEISTLHFDERLEIDLDYLFCLFEIGRYERFLSKVDYYIELVITENIIWFKDEDVFQELLFKKAASYFQLNNFEKCKLILKQLIKINPSNPVFIGLYTICKRKTENDIYLTIKAMAIAALLIVIGITLASIILEPFLAFYLKPFILLRALLLIFAFGCLIGLEIAFQYKIFRETGMFPHKLLNKVFGTQV